MDDRKPSDGLASQSNIARHQRQNARGERRPENGSPTEMLDAPSADKTAKLRSRGRRREIEGAPPGRSGWPPGPILDEDGLRHDRAAGQAGDDARDQEGAKARHDKGNARPDEIDDDADEQHAPEGQTDPQPRADDHANRLAD